MIRPNIDLIWKLIDGMRKQALVCILCGDDDATFLAVSALPDFLSTFCARWFHWTVMRRLNPEAV